MDAYRGRSSVLVDGHILIDCGATVPDAIRHFGVDVDAITDILLTHSHGDHCDAAAIEHLVSMGTRGDPINLWAHPSALAKLAGIDRLRKRELQPGKTVGFSSLAVTALPANHQVPEDTALHFLLQKPKASLLYATDGAWFLKGAWILLKEVKIDALLWDATCGEAQGDWRIFEHNSVDMIRVMRQTL
ncbi:MAG: MBL fold metallo-hydrolase, partial [Candidatus Latescibacteria bacterium]|nr:MBL fold metallo-hydrolase [Candidatus Latescibacterota bacterium]